MRKLTTLLLVPLMLALSFLSAPAAALSFGDPGVLLAGLAQPAPAVTLAAAETAPTVAMAPALAQKALSVIKITEARRQAPPGSLMPLVAYAGGVAILACAMALPDPNEEGDGSGGGDPAAGSPAPQPDTRTA